MPAKKISITLHPVELVREIEARVTGDGRNIDATGPSQVISRDLERYYSALREARQRLASLLTPDEQALLADNLNGIMLADAWTLRGIAHNVQDCLDGLAEKWGVNGPELLRKLSSLTLIELCAIAVAVEHFRHSVSAGAEADPRLLLR